MKNFTTENTEQNPDAMVWTVDVRQRNGTYFARIMGQNFQVSCTASAQWAAKACAEKFCARRKLKLIDLDGDAGISVWILSTVPNSVPSVSSVVKNSGVEK